MNEVDLRVLSGAIQDYIAIEPRTLQDLVELTGVTPAEVSWACHYLRSKGIIALNPQGYFCTAECFLFPPPMPSRWERFIQSLDLRIRSLFAGIELQACCDCGEIYPERLLVNGRCCVCDRRRVK